MRRLVTCCVLLFQLLTGCVLVLDHVPGPESPELLVQSSGTIVLSEANASGSNHVVLIDLPTLRRREFEFERDPAWISGPNDRGELIYVHEESDGLSSNFGLLTGGLFDDGEPYAASLRAHDVATGIEREVAPLANRLGILAVAPVGPYAIVEQAAPAKPSSTPAPRSGSLVRLCDLETGAMREVEHELGKVWSCDWLQDGRSFALSGDEGGARYDVETLACIGRNANGYGPFTPAGDAYCVNRNRQCLLIRIEGDHEVASEALLFGGYPSPSDAGVWTEPVGLCAPRLCLYLAFPTEGRDRSWSGNAPGFVLSEAPAVKIGAVDGRAFVTAVAANAGRDRPLYSPCRLSEFQR